MVDSNPYGVIQEEDCEGEDGSDKGPEDSVMASSEILEVSYKPLQEREGIGTMSDCQYGDKIIKDLKIIILTPCGDVHNMPWKF
jgi:hypothetical protein